MNSEWKPNTLYKYKEPQNATNFPYDTTFFVAYSANTNLNPPYQDINYTGITVGNWNVAGCEWTNEYADFYYNSNDTIRRYTDSKTHVGDFTNMAVIVDSYTPATQYCLFPTQFTSLPFNYDIDYVRIYQIKQDCNPKSYLTTNSSTYQNKLYQNLSIGGIGGSALFNSGISHLSAQDYVLLEEGFQANGANTTVIIDTRKCQSGQNITHPHFDQMTLPYNWKFRLNRPQLTGLN